MLKNLEKPRVLVFGGRNYADFGMVCQVLDQLFSKFGMECLIHGAATGADSLAKEWAAARNVPLEPYPARWDDLQTPPVVLRYTRTGRPYNAAAGGVRNQRMLDEGRPNIAVGFPGGSGTADMIERLRSAEFREFPGEVCSVFVEKGFDFFSKKK